MTGLLTFASLMLRTAAVIGLTLLVAFSAPAVESRFWPVGRYATVEIAGRAGDTVDVAIYGIKLRQCRLLDLSALILTPADGGWQRADITINERPIEMRQRATGVQSFGVWRLRPNGTRVKIVAWHECHGLWSTYTNLGEWPLP